MDQHLTDRVFRVSYGVTDVFDVDKVNIVSEWQKPLATIKGEREVQTCQKVREGSIRKHDSHINSLVLCLVFTV